MKRWISGIAVLLVLAVSQSASAGFITFDDGGVHDIATSVPGLVSVMYAPTTLNMLPGGLIGGDTLYSGNAFGIATYLGGTVNISGGQIGGNTVYGSGGTVGVQAYSHSTVNISGGQIGGNTVYSSSGGAGVWASDHSTVNISGGQIGGNTFYARAGASAIAASGGSTVNISGGTFGGNTFYGGGGGTVISESGGSAVNISGGTFGGDMLTANNAYFTVFDRSTLSISGGKFGVGGPAKFDVFFDGRVSIFGTGFNFPDGGITADSGTLFGFLLNGDPIRLDFLQHNGGAIGLNVTLSPPPPSTVPVPSSIVGLGSLFATVGIAAGWRRWRYRKAA